MDEKELQKFWEIKAYNIEIISHKLRRQLENKMFYDILPNDVSFTGNRYCGLLSRIRRSMTELSGIEPLLFTEIQRELEKITFDDCLGLVDGRAGDLILYCERNTIENKLKLKMLDMWCDSMVSRLDFKDPGIIHIANFLEGIKEKNRKNAFNLVKEVKEA
jgi:hypothetical protein